MKKNGFNTNFKEFPPTEKELFQLNVYPVLDKVKGISCFCDEHLYKEVLLEYLSELSKTELEFINAYKNNDWRQIKSLADREGDGACYCGAIRLWYACRFLEYNCETKVNKNILDALYEQTLNVMEQTRRAIDLTYK